MTPERFQQIEELYHAARERSADERAALLKEARNRAAAEVAAGKERVGKELAAARRDIEASVGQLAAELPVSRSAVSQHLKVLKDAGLVSERAVGTRRLYRLNPAAVAALRDQLDAFWQRALASYVDVAEQATEESP